MGTRTLILVAVQLTAMCDLGEDTPPLGLSCICQTGGLIRLLPFEGPSPSSNLLGSILSREPHLWGRGNGNILSAQIQLRHMPAQPRPALLAWSCCHLGRALWHQAGPRPPAPCQGRRWVAPSCPVVGQEDRGRGWGRRGKCNLAEECSEVARAGP